MESILTSIKKLLGIDENNTAFDVDIISDINTVLFRLHQLGIGQNMSFQIDDSYAVWDDFLGVDAPEKEIVKHYVHRKVQYVFDPPSNTNLMRALENDISETEWALLMHSRHVGKDVYK